MTHRRQKKVCAAAVPLGHPVPLAPGLRAAPGIAVHVTFGSGSSSSGWQHPIGAWAEAHVQLVQAVVGYPCTAPEPGEAPAPGVAQQAQQVGRPSRGDSATASADGGEGEKEDAPAAECEVGQVV